MDVFSRWISDVCPFGLVINSVKSKKDKVYNAEDNQLSIVSACSDCNGNIFILERGEMILGVGQEFLEDPIGKNKKSKKLSTSDGDVPTPIPHNPNLLLHPLHGSNPILQLTGCIHVGLLRIFFNCLFFRFFLFFE
jgi:hypothetical protein